MFSLKLTARPDARMVEVPLEIEAELPREFEGAALLASSGLPRRVRLKATKDALKLSTAYRADRLVGDIVRGALRGTSADVQRVQDAVMKFVRAVRERRQEGATLVVSSNGRGKIDVVEVPGSRPPTAVAPLQPYENARPAAAPPDRLTLLERRVGELEAALARLSAAGELAERLAHLEQKLAPARGSRALGSADIAGPGQENGAPTSGRNGAPRRATALDAYADGLRGELRTRAAEAAARTRAETERCNRAAALAVDAELLGAPHDGTSQRLREISAQVAARQSALERLLQEIEFYPGPELPMAAQLLARLEEPAARDPAPLLESAAEAVVRAAKGADIDSRGSWLQRATALCGWQLVAPAPGDKLQLGWHQPVEPGGETVVALVCAGLKRADGTPMVEARVKVSAAVPANPPAPEQPETLAAAVAAAPPPAAAVPVPAEPIPALVAQPAPPASLPEPPQQPIALLPPPPDTTPLAVAAQPGGTVVRSEEPPASSLAAAHALRIVSEDPAANDEALAHVADQVDGEVVDVRTDG